MTGSKTSPLIEKKQEALSFFLQQLLSSELRGIIAKAIVFGSFVREEAEPESDIDLFIQVLDAPKQVSEICADLSLETMLRYGERVEPIIGHVDDYHINPYFYRKVLGDGEEVYAMAQQDLEKGEARNFLNLAVEFLNQSRSNLGLGNYRLLIDGSYNVVELCAKGLLLLKGEEIPKRHGSIVQQFSEKYIKTGVLSREIGRNLNRALESRNRARYSYQSPVTKEDAEAVLQLAEDMVKALEDQL